MSSSAAPPAGRVDWTGWKNFAIAMGALAAALVLALFSSAATEAGHLYLAGALALAALGVAGWVSLTIVPRLARRTSLRWLNIRTDYRVTREGVVYLIGIFVVALAAVNTGNNLLFLVLACLLAGILISGVLSQMVLSGVELRLELPDHIFAGRPVMALAELVNHKQTLPSFSLRLAGISDKPRRGDPKGEKTVSEILPRPVYFPFLPRRQAVQQNVELLFPRRGVYRQDALGLRTKFPFGFLEKTRRVDSSLHAVVYPPVEPTDQLMEILPLVTGELESFLRGRGQDLYSIRDYQTTDSTRHVDWKATAKTGLLQVREFAREDERRVLLVLDPVAGPALAPPTLSPAGAPESAFERGVALCASLAWHFYQIDSVLGFRTAGFETPMAPAGEIIYDVLRHLASAAPQSPDQSQEAPDPAARSLLDELADATGLFKIILTCQPRGTIPTNLWNSSYILFLNS